MRVNKHSCSQVPRIEKLTIIEKSELKIFRKLVKKQMDAFFVSLRYALV